MKQYSADRANSCFFGQGLFSFRPERVLFRPGGVNLQACLCGVQSYASAQSLDFLARTKNPSFPNRKPLRDRVWKWPGRFMRQIAFDSLLKLCKIQGPVYRETGSTFLEYE